MLVMLPVVKTRVAGVGRPALPFAMRTESRMPARCRLGPRRPAVSVSEGTAGASGRVRPGSRRGECARNDRAVSQV